MFMESLDQLEQIFRCRLFVAYDDCPQAWIAGRVLVEPRGNVGADPRLPGFQDDNPNTAGLCFLLFNDPVQLTLGTIEQERRKASGLRPDFQELGSKIFKIGVEPNGAISS